MHILLGIVLTIVWIINILNYDSKAYSCSPNENECNSCPFPCEKHKY